MFDFVPKFYGKFKSWKICPKKTTIRKSDSTHSSAKSISNSGDAHSQIYNDCIFVSFSESTEEAIKKPLEEAIKKPLEEAIKKLEKDRKAISDPSNKTESNSETNQGNTDLPESIKLLLREGKLEEVIASLSEYIRHHPDSHLAFRTRGFAHSEQGNYSLALDDLDQAINLKIDFVDAYHDRAVVFRRMEKFEYEADELEKELVFDPDRILALSDLGTLGLFLGRSALQKGKVELGKYYYYRSIKNLTNCLEKGDQNPYTYYSRAIVRLELDAVDLALEDIDKSISIEHKFTMGHLLKGQVYVGLGKRRLGTRKPEAIRALQLAANCLKTAIQFDERLLSGHMELGKLYFFLATNNLRLDHKTDRVILLSEAMICFLRARDIGEEIGDQLMMPFINSHLGAARVLYARSLPSSTDLREELLRAAISNIDEAMNSEKSEPLPQHQVAVLLCLRGHANSLLGNSREAINDIDRATTIDPKNPQQLLLLGMVWLVHGKRQLGEDNRTHADKSLEQSVKFFSEVISLRPRWSQAYESRSEAYSLLRDEDRAQKDRKTAIELSKKQDKKGDG